MTAIPTQPIELRHSDIVLPVRCGQVAGTDLTVWTVQVKDILPSMLKPDIIAQILSPDETARHKRFHFAKDRELFAAAHLLKRLALARLSGDDPATLSFIQGEHGKPGLGAPVDLHFNLSHSDGMAALAISPTQDVGIDVEAFGRKIDHDQLAKQVLTKAEHARLRVALPDDRTKTFLDHWVVKEAFSKAYGQGLSLSFTSLHIEFQHNDVATVSRSGVQDRRAKCRLFAPCRGYIAAVVWLANDSIHAQIG